MAADLTRSASVAMALFLGVAATEARAQRYPAFGSYPPDRLVERIARVTRDNLGRARLPNGQPVPEETPEQRAGPLVPAWFDRQIVERGKISAFARWCGLDWQTRSFAPFMGHVRRAGTWTPRQIAYVSLLHGVAMGMFSDVRKNGDCPDRLKERLGAHLDRLLTPDR